MRTTNQNKPLHLPVYDEQGRTRIPCQLMQLLNVKPGEYFEAFCINSQAVLLVKNTANKLTKLAAKDPLLMSLVMEWSRGPSEAEHSPSGVPLITPIPARGGRPYKKQKSQLDPLSL